MRQSRNEDITAIGIQALPKRIPLLRVVRDAMEKHDTSLGFVAVRVDTSPYRSSAADGFHRCRSDVPVHRHRAPIFAGLGVRMYPSVGRISGVFAINLVDFTLFPPRMPALRAGLPCAVIVRYMSPWKSVRWGYHAVACSNRLGRSSATWVPVCRK